MSPAKVAVVLLAATGLALSDPDVCSGDSCDTESTDDPSLLAHRIRRVTDDDCPATTHSGHMDTGILHSDIDFPLIEGNNTIHFPDKEMWKECAGVCSERPDCHAWTFHFHQQNCYLKGDVSFCSTAAGGRWSYNDCCISGGHNVVKSPEGALNNADCHGDSIAEMTSTQEQWQDCQQKCMQTSVCKGWTYTYQQKQCYIKGADSNIDYEPWKFDANTISGLK